MDQNQILDSQSARYSALNSLSLTTILFLSTTFEAHAFSSIELPIQKSLAMGFHWCALFVVLTVIISTGTFFFFSHTLNRKVLSATEQLKAELALREQAEQQLKHANEQLDGIFNATTEFVALIDADGTLLRANQAYAEYYSTPLNQFVGSTLFDYCSDKHASQWRQMIDRVLSTGNPERFDYFEKGRSFDCSVFPMQTQDSDKQLLSLFIRDMTRFQELIKESKRTSRILQDMNTELEGIIRIASHDLRTPLVTINGFAGELANACGEMTELLLNCECTSPMKEKVQDIIEKDILVDIDLIKAGTGKIESLVSSLVKLARIGRTELQHAPIDMTALMEKIQKSMAFQIREHQVQIRTDLIPDCVGDESMINQVMTNLISNAIKYRHNERPISIRVTGRTQDDMAVYCVEDNGQGIAPEHQDKIFELFYRQDPQTGEGEGLGLTIVRGIVTRHNGRIWVESIPDEGSRFYVSLPKLSKPL